MVSCDVRSQSPSSSRVSNQNNSTSTPPSSAASLRGLRSSSIPNGSMAIIGKDGNIIERPSCSALRPAASPVRQYPEERSSSVVSNISSSRSILARKDPLATDSNRGSFGSQDRPDNSETDDYDHEQIQPRSYEHMQESMLSDSTAASGIFDKISLLPDELVCVGLSMGHEQSWRNKLINAIFFYGDVLPVGDQTKRAFSFERGNTGTHYETGKNQDMMDQTVNSESSDMAINSSRTAFSMTPKSSRLIEGRFGRSAGQRSSSSSSDTSENSTRLVRPTQDAEYPVRFARLLPHSDLLITFIRRLSSRSR